jgi:hypothetical protein
MWYSHIGSIDAEVVDESLRKARSIIRWAKAGGKLGTSKLVTPPVTTSIH